ncbi:N-6 DNA methylase [candidate division WOR-3 bacterium]|nr:N-6 DNA methylase [candidate division WOR-3 bacterium]
MSITKEKAKENLRELVAKFDREAAAGRINDYNEQATKTAFIQPLLRDVLGWDVSNRDEVSPEEKVSRGRVDYGLKTEGQTKIFVEAKPPRADLTRHIEQAIGYGYNRKSVPFVLLTDFEDIKLFDVTVKPDTRNQLKGLKIALNWKEYVDEFDQLWLLSKESVLNGDLDRLLLKKPKDRLPVDKAILDDLKKWREMLAKDIFRNNTEMFHSGDREKDAQYLKEITQRIIDRIIFMRSCEDRKLVYRDPLRKVFEDRTESVGKQTMVFLSNEFKHYNIIFDSDLFRPLDWEKNLAIDFKVMRDIVLETYNPYQFDVIPLDVLGNIYEQYLGHTIRLTDHQVKYELKPDVRKAGGVYYTPEYIVDYIVKNTVGKLLQELPPRKIKKLRVLDPACGSGSFLIRAYEEMLNWHKNQKKGSGAIHRTKRMRPQQLIKHEDQEPILTIEEKSRILREHIFGVDIDEQAVEVTKLSLMLKMLEGEFGIIPGRNILPMLDKNIRCGNSLISGDTLELKKYFGNDWYKVKAFNWKDKFRKIMVDEGGFDVVIGNPPYVSFGLRGAKRYGEDLGTYIRENYPNSAEYKISTYALFMDRGLQQLKGRCAYFSFIVPDSFILGRYFSKLRRLILDKCRIIEIVMFVEDFWKSGVVGRPVIIILEKTSDKRTREANHVVAKLTNNLIDFGTDIYQDFAYNQNCFEIIPHNRFRLFFDESSMKLVGKMEINSLRLRDIVSIHTGVRSKIGQKNIISKQKKTDKWKKGLISGREIDRYILKYEGNYLHIDSSILWSGGFDDNIVARDKIVMRQTGDSLIATMDETGLFHLNNCHSIVLREKLDGNYSIKYILALINSKPLNHFYHLISLELGRPMAQTDIETLELLPIPKIDFSKSSESELHDKLVKLVDVMLDLNRTIQLAKGSEKEQTQRQIEKTDEEIDDLVYKLYEITEEERKVIEGTSE